MIRTPRLRFVVPADLDRPTGGNRYDLALARALTEAGTDVELCRLPGRWPDPTAGETNALTGHLTGPSPVLVDGLLGCGAPAAVAAATLAGCPVHLLVHMPLALDPALDTLTAADRDTREGRSLRAATGVLATSGWTAAELRRRHGVVATGVAGPGADPAPPARGSAPPLLRHLATLSPVKDQLTVVAALARLSHLAWTAELTGAADVHPGYTAAVRTAIAESGLTERVRITGPLHGPELAAAWDATDLLLLPSRAETWGLAVTEALSRAIPAVVSRGTGAVEALGSAPDGALPGACVPSGDGPALAAAVAHLLGPGGEIARRAARCRRAELPGWPETAQAVLSSLTPVGAR